MPDLFDLTTSFDSSGGPTREWQQVRSQLKKVYPTMLDGEWTDTLEKSPAEWQRAVDTVVGARDFPDEYVIWLVDAINPDAVGTSILPDAGRRVIIDQWTIASGNFTVLAHELGHAFGLMHTFGPGQFVDRDPQTLAALTLWDRWDLVYKPGLPSPSNTPHLFFNNRQQAAAHPLSSLEYVDTNDGKCAVIKAGVVSCNIGTCKVGEGNCRIETHASGSPALKGLGREQSPIGPRSANAMSYFHDRSREGFLSGSQTNLVRKAIRYSIPIQSAILKPGQTVFSANLPLLGGANIRQVADHLDFDCDGKRDIAFWEPPSSASSNGVFRVLLSSKNFGTSTGQYLLISLGKLGDIPMAGEFSGDCATDVAVFQPGGGINRDNPKNTQGYWRWCPTKTPSPSGTECLSTPPQVRQFGDRGDIPLPGLKMDTTGIPVLTMFNPRNGLWRWRTSADVPNPQVQSRTLGNAGAVPLPGLHDYDALTDLAAYEAGTATFKLLRSELGWNSPITRTFGSSYVAQMSGTELQRTGAIPLSGMTRSETVFVSNGYMGYWTQQPRRVFSLYKPQGGNVPASWMSMWDPVNSSAIDGCSHGSDVTDIPIAGIDLDGDRYSDMMIYRPQTVTGSGMFLKKRYGVSGPTRCAGPETSIVFAGLNEPGTRVFAVSDMTGDGLPEVMILSPNSCLIRWLTSESGYTVVESRTFCVNRSVML